MLPTNNNQNQIGNDEIDTPILLYLEALYSAHKKGG